MHPLRTSPSTRNGCASGHTCPDLVHGVSLESLPFHHRDPLDRLLAGQALTENLTAAHAQSRKCRISRRFLTLGSLL